MAYKVSRLARRYATAAGGHSQPPLNGLNSNARARAEQLSSEWKGTHASGGNTKNYIGGEFIESSTKDWIEVLDPVSLQHI
jgi:malonate-semialdehyde dehydrogenase (acetylating) / methylmalonate-semialdehyde dehydrogenase